MGRGRLARALGLAPFDARCALVSSPLVGPRVLAGARLALALWMTATTVVELARDGAAQDRAFFAYFTHLSYTGLLAYLWAAGVQTALYARNAARGDHTYPLQRWPRPLQAAHVALQSTATAFPLLVTAVFWALLSGPGTLAPGWAAWENLSVHALNTALAGAEVLLTNSAPPPWAYLASTFGCLAAYLGVAYLAHATQGFYPYAFLDPAREKGFLAVYIVGIGVAGVVAFTLVWAAMWARGKLVRRLVARGVLRERLAPVARDEEGSEAEDSCEKA